MSAEDREASEKEIMCRRINRHLPVGEHLECPYCDGKRADVETGDRKNFCDFKPGEDPICFGFPDIVNRPGV
jgi:hypothetical protein